MLAQRFPNQAQFALDEARAQLRGGHAAATIALLSEPRWQRQSIALRIFAQLNLSAGYGVMGDASNARIAALRRTTPREGSRLEIRSRDGRTSRHDR